MKAGIHPNTQLTYSSAQRQYMQFCNLFDFSPIPATEQIILLLVTYLHNKQNNPRSIQVYLSGVASLHVMSGYPAPPTTAPCVKLVLKGLLERATPQCQKLPLAYNILYRMHSLMQSSYDDKLWVAVIDLAFVGCLRAAELTIPISRSFDPAIHLCMSDVQFCIQPSGVHYVCVNIKRTKLQLMVSHC